MRENYDIIICSGAPHFEELKRLLPLLSPHGTVHLVSTGPNGRQTAAIASLVGTSVPWFERES